MRTTKTVSKALTACAAISLSLGLGMGAANAIPPGGASENTPGTSSTVSPHVTPGGVVNFTLTGFPENTQVTVKLDDDGVVHRQTTDSKGNLNGSFVLSNAGSGDHTLASLQREEAEVKTPTVVIKVIREGGIPIRALYLPLENPITGAAIMAARQITEGPLRAAPILRPTITPDLTVRVIMVPKVTAVTRHRTVVHLSKRLSILMLMATLSLKKSMIA